MKNDQPHLFPNPPVPAPASAPHARHGPIIWTYGYSGHSVDELAAVLERTGATLVDVRFKPFSRQPGFSKTALARRFGDRYVHVPELGNLDYKGSTIRLANMPVGLARVRGLLTVADVMLICVCAYAQACHRRPVADAISIATGARIEHII